MRKSRGSPGRQSSLQTKAERAAERANDKAERAREAVRQALREKNLSVIAEALQLSRQAISRWQQVPPHHVLAVAAVTGLSPHFLRPDLYPADWAPIAAE